MGIFKHHNIGFYIPASCQWEFQDLTDEGTLVPYVWPAIDNVGKTIMGMVLEQFYHISMGGNPTINQNMNSITINSLLMWVKQCHKPPYDWE